MEHKSILGKLLHMISTIVRFINLRILLVLTILIFVPRLVSAQTDTTYTLIHKLDTFSIDLSAWEKTESQKKRHLLLHQVGKNKTKKLRERTINKMKLLFNDTIFHVFVIDYYDDYLIGFLNTKKKISKKEHEFKLLGYRRIRYDTMQKMETDGHRTILPKTVLAFASMGTGFVVSSQIIRGMISPYFIPLGIGAFYVTYKLVDAFATKEFYLYNATTQKAFNDVNSKLPKRYQLKAWVIEVVTKK